MYLLRRLWRKALAVSINHLASPPLILNYHRVAAPAFDPWSLSIHPNAFESQIRYLSRFYNVIHFSELVKRITSNDLPPRTLVITFDDGYSDNLLEAKKILDYYETPATFFLSPGLLDGNTEFWWDELASIFLTPGSLPSKLNLVVGDLVLDRSLGASATYSLQESLEYQRWSVIQEPPTLRHSLYIEIHSILKPLSHADRSTVFNKLREWASHDLPLPMPSLNRPLSLEEARTLTHGGLHEVGAHTMNHISLPAHSIPIQTNEISQSKSICQSIAGKTVEVFSYPYGDHDSSTVELVRRLGFIGACTTRLARVSAFDDSYTMPRVHVSNSSISAFARRLMTVA